MKTKIPPPIIALICIAINYLSTYLINPIKFPNIEIIGGLILLFGLITAILAIILFKKTETTINPPKVLVGFTSKSSARKVAKT